MGNGQAVYSLIRHAVTRHAHHNRSKYQGFPAQILPGMILSAARRMQWNIEPDPQSIGGWSVA